MKRLRNKQIFLYLYFLLTAFLFFYISSRAYFLSFTYDESTTFLLIHDHSYKELFETANNHLINSLLVWIISEHIGSSEFWLRLPNVLSFILYGVYLFRFLLQIKNIWVKVFGAMFLLLNPYLLDFFSLARGYGLAMGFCMASLFYVVNSGLNENDLSANRSRIKAIAFAVLAVLSNLVLLNYLMSIIILFVIQDIFSKRLTTKNITAWLKSNIVIFLLLFILTLILYPIIKILIEKNQLYHGGKNSFWTDTVQSLVEYSLYLQSYPSPIKFVVLICIIISFFLFGIISTFQFYKTRIMQIDTAMFIVLIFSILFPIIQKTLLNTLLPVGRTALFYILIFGFFVITSFDKIISYKTLSRFVIVAMFFLSMGISYHFLRTENCSYTVNWKYDANTKEAVETMNTIAKKKEGNLTIGIDWIFEPSTRYYRVKNDYSWLFTTMLNTPWASQKEIKEAQSKPYSIYYLGSDRNLGEVFKQQNLKELKQYAVSGSMVYENIQP
jgi:hypothetical protein